MKKYLNIFNNQTDYKSQKETVMGVPHVVLLEESDEVIYVSDELNYAWEYFTIHALSDGDMTLYIPSSYEANSLAYSLNDSDWVNFDAETTLSLENDNKVRVKCVTTAYNRDSNQPMFSGSCEYEVYGNIMSLLYGDTFAYKTELNDNHSFKSLFCSQSTLKHAQNLILPATTLASYCYYNMFRDCTSLITAPQLPATTLVDSCYSFMFYNCTSLTEVPKLIATTLDVYCYGNMFNGCTSLVEAPELPATTLANNCYNAMFASCTNLTIAPQLLATTLADGCYMEMFSNCTSLTIAPELPTTTLADSCYREMFSNCTSLIEAPKLQSTTLANYCYYSMFLNCTSLVEAPELLATILVNGCYYRMFRGCSKLNKITMLAIDIRESSCLYNWVNGVANSGTFVKHPQMTTLPSGDSGIPNGWAVQDYNIDYSVKFFTIRALNDGEMVLYSPKSFSPGSFQYSLDNKNWIQLSVNQNILSLNKNDELRVQCITNTYSNENNSTMFSGSCEYEVYGNILSLLYGSMFKYYDTLKSNNSFKYMFDKESTLKHANNLILPVNALKDNCYQNMFYNCTNLTTAPELLATTLAESCYRSMFANCTSLVEAPDLPATTLAQSCYQNMFSNCTSLTSTPELLATTLARTCYFNMFNGCSNLNKITMLATDISATDCLLYWVSGVASSGTFIKNAAMTTLPSGVSGIPEGWTVKNIEEIDYASQPFTLVALEDGTMNIGIPYGTNSMYYALNDNDWIEMTESVSLTMNTNDKVKIKAIGTSFSNSCSSVFSSTMSFNAEGNVMSLLYGDDFQDKTSLEGMGYECFRALFMEMNIYSAKNLILPATTLVNGCYQDMFSNCTSLTEAPELLATTLAEGCYRDMFYKCTSLTEAPELPATTLADWCYSGMFSDCTSLTEAPELQATTLADYCYSNMFFMCSKLNYIKMLATDISASSCLSNWVSGVASSGTFVKHPQMTSLLSGKDGIPNRWTVQNEGTSTSNIIVETDETSISILSNVEISEDSISINGENIKIVNDENNNYNIIIE